LIDVQKVRTTEHVKCDRSRLRYLRKISGFPRMQPLELTLVELGELALEKSGMRLPCRIARERRERRILRKGHPRKEPRDVVGPSADWVNWDRARRDLGILLCKNAECSRDDRQENLHRDLGEILRFHAERCLCVRFPAQK
jgi:hypothetical protein